MLQKTATNLSVSLFVVTTAIMGCSTKNDDGAKQSTTFEVEAAQIQQKAKKFRTKDGQCSFEFLTDLSDESLLAKLRSLKDHVLSQPELDRESVRSLALIAKNSCDKIVGSYDQPMSLAPAEGETAEETIQREESQNCYILNEDGSIHTTIKIDELKSKCEKASALSAI
ncbi:MAG: hypothetical protein ACK5P5_11330 [Pseudobdellovibrionaceae bacterium]